MSIPFDPKKTIQSPRLWGLLPPLWGQSRCHCPPQASPLCLALGDVTGGIAPACCGDGSTITLPPCRTYVTEGASAPVEPPCQVICGEEEACCCPCIWTSTTKKASACAVGNGEPVTFTITFTNHSSASLDAVCITDTLPAGMQVVPGSIQPAPKPGETLETGITMGPLAAGQSAVLSYAVTVQFGACCRLVNCAQAAYRYTDCNHCCHHGVGGRRSCTIWQIPKGACLCITKCANKRMVYRCGEQIRYTLTVLNPGQVALTHVAVFDEIPQGLCYLPGSTTLDCGLPVDQNPLTGIPLGTLAAGEKVCIAFTLVVCTDLCQAAGRQRFINCARAKGFACCIPLCAKSRPWVVTGLCCSHCRWVKKSCCVYNLQRLEGCRIYHRGTEVLGAVDAGALLVKYGVLIKYRDWGGRLQTTCQEGETIFCGPQDLCGLGHFTIRFTDISCQADADGCVTTQFAARVFPLPVEDTPRQNTV